MHGLAAPIGGRFAAPHGAVCATLLPDILEINLAALRGRDAANPVLARFDEVARLLTGSPTATADDGVAWVRALGQALGTAPLRQFGLSAEHFAALIENAPAAGSRQSNPITLTPEELEEILQRAT